MPTQPEETTPSHVNAMKKGGQYVYLPGNPPRLKLDFEYDVGQKYFQTLAKYLPREMLAELKVAYEKGQLGQKKGEHRLSWQYDEEEKRWYAQILPRSFGRTIRLSRNRQEVQNSEHCDAWDEALRKICQRAHRKGGGGITDKLEYIREKLRAVMHAVPAQVKAGNIYAAIAMAQESYIGQPGHPTPDTLRRDLAIAGLTVARNRYKWLEIKPTIGARTRASREEKLLRIAGSFDPDHFHVDYRPGKNRIYVAPVTARAKDFVTAISPTLGEKAARWWEQKMKGT